MVFDLNDAAFIADPYPVYDALRARSPVLWDEDHHMWLVTGWAETQTALRTEQASVRTSSARIEATLGPTAAAHYAPVMNLVGGFMTRLDGTDHARLRSLVLKAFTPQAVHALTELIETIAHSLLDAHAGSIDLVEDFARPLPLSVIARLLGISAADEITHIKSWADALGGITDLDPQVEVLDRGLEAAQNFRAYIEATIADRRHHAGSDLLSGLVAVQENGDRLSLDELVGIVGVLLIAGHETTSGLLANGLQLFLSASRPAAADMADAVEEVLRYESPVQARVRRAVSPFELGGQSIAAGDLLYLMIGAANRDPRHFVDAAVFNARRKPDRHVAFGEGPHYCLGSALARLEGRIAFTAALSRPALELTSVALTRRPNFTMRSWSSLPCTI